MAHALQWRGVMRRGLAFILILSTSPGVVRADDDAEADAGDEIRFTPELQVRARGEGRLGPYASSAGGPVEGVDRAEVLSRVRAGVQASHDFVTLRATVQNVGRFGQAAPGVTDGSQTGLHQGYLQIGDDDLYLRLGRQEIGFGDQRLIGVLDWAMGGRTFDAARVHTASKSLSLDVFAAVVRMRREVVDSMGATTDSSGDHLAGLNLGVTEHAEASLEAYVFFRHDGPHEQDALRDRYIVCPGLRLFGRPIPRLKYSLEGMFQAGSVRELEQSEHGHRAAALTAELTGELLLPERLALSLGGSVATGQARDGSWNEFDNFYPTNHKFYGSLDLIGLRNSAEGHLQLDSDPWGGVLTATSAAHLLALADGRGRWSSAGGTALGESDTAGSAFLGAEFDLRGRWTPIEALFIEAGYSVFFPGSGAARLGHENATHFAYLWLASRLP